MSVDDEHGIAQGLREALAAAPQPPAEAQRCTCPSGDGSLRWPCPTHPPEAQAQGGGEVCIEAHWLENVAAAASLLEASGDVFNVREAAALRKLIASAERTAPTSAPVGVRATQEDRGEFCSDTAALAFLHLLGNGNPNVERAVERLRSSLIALAQQPAAVDGAMVELRKLSALATQGELVARVIERGGQIIDAFLTVPSIEQGRTIAGPVPMEWLADDSYHEGGPEQKAHDARFTAAAVNYVRALAAQPGGANHG